MLIYSIIATVLIQPCTPNLSISVFTSRLKGRENDGNKRDLVYLHMVTISFLGEYLVLVMAFCQYLTSALTYVGYNQFLIVSNYSFGKRLTTFSGKQLNAYGYVHVSWQ